MWIKNDDVYWWLGMWYGDRQQHIHYEFKKNNANFIHMSPVKFNWKNCNNSIARNIDEFHFSLVHRC